MPMDVILLDEAGHQVRGLPDPSGGTFDAAGDFDRLIKPGDRSAVWSLLDPHGQVRLDQQQAASLMEELPGLLALAQPGAEHRGLERLRVLVEQASTDPKLVLVFTGD